MKRYVIIGNGVAAVNCIEGIREKDGKGKITVISEEKHEVYCRPLISYYLDALVRQDLRSGFPHPVINIHKYRRFASAGRFFCCLHMGGTDRSYSEPWMKI